MGIDGVPAFKKLSRIWAERGMGRLAGSCTVLTVTGTPIDAWAGAILAGSSEKNL